GVLRKGARLESFASPERVAGCFERTFSRWSAVDDMVLWRGGRLANGQDSPWNWGRKALPSSRIAPAVPLRGRGLPDSEKTLSQVHFGDSVQSFCRAVWEYRHTGINTRELGLHDADQ